MQAHQHTPPTQKTMRPSAVFLLYPLALWLSSSILAAEAAAFTCNATATAKCQSFVSYAPFNASTYAAVQSLFQVPSLSSLLGANNLSLSTVSTNLIQPKVYIRVPITCACASGTGASSGGPTYTVKPGDGLDAIARYTFGGLVTFQEIAAASRIPNPDNIMVGQNVTIPLPCSCDPVGSREAVHLAYTVLSGDSVGGIAHQFGVDNQTLMAINNISDPKKLMADQILDVPLKACSSSIKSNALDSTLRLPSGSYALTANNCVLCSCTSSYQLECHAQGSNAATCHVPKCGNLPLGANSTSGCELSTCAYAGYTNTTSSGINILISTTTTNQSICNNGGVSPATQPSPPLAPSFAPRLGLHGLYWTPLVILLHSYGFGLL